MTSKKFEATVWMATALAPVNVLKMVKSGNFLLAVISTPLAKRNATTYVASYRLIRKLYERRVVS